MGTYRPKHAQRRTAQKTATVDMPKSPEAQPTAYEQERDRKTHNLAAVGVAVDSVLTFFTLVAAGTALYVAILNQQAVNEAAEANALTKQQIALAERPWISDAPVAHGTFSLAPSGQWVLNVAHYLTNHGKSPAVSVTARSRLLAIGSDPNSNPIPHESLREICATLTGGDRLEGDTLFPGQSVGIVESVGMNPATLAKVRATYRNVPSNDGEPAAVVLLLATCVGYRGSFDPAYGQTPLIMQVGIVDEATGRVRAIAPEKAPPKVDLVQTDSGSFLTK